MIGPAIFPSGDPPAQPSLGPSEATFADYGVTAPMSAAVISVEGHGTTEFQLYFTRCPPGRDGLFQQATILLTSSEAFNPVR